ncbi:hypothetical protein KJ611_04325 [Patescibacteria group bacterium]|nr:hypothetical protein [Patescibacteria group bacterium]MBU1705548.1 hypothetical protein [Patescibacteria group bacterium]
MKKYLTYLLLLFVGVISVWGLSKAPSVLADVASTVVEVVESIEQEEDEDPGRNLLDNRPDPSRPVVFGWQSPSVETGIGYLSWRTNVPTTAEVRYRILDSAYPVQSVSLGDQLRVRHFFDLAGFLSDTKYEIQIVSRDAGGRQSVSNWLIIETLPASDNIVIRPPIVPPEVPGVIPDIPPPIVIEPDLPGEEAGEEGTESLQPERVEDARLPIINDIVEMFRFQVDFDEFEINGFGKFLSILVTAPPLIFDKFLFWLNLWWLFMRQFLMIWIWII